MTALAAPRSQMTPSKWTRRQFTLLSGQIAYHGGLAAVVISGTNAGKFVAATGAANQRLVGKFAETVNASASGTNADTPVTVEFPREKTLTPVVNGASTDAAAVGNVGQVLYVLDDQTSTVVPNVCPLGRLWGFDGSSRCLVDLDDVDGAPIYGGTLPAPVSADVIVPLASIRQGASYTLPALAANSTVTLPVTGVPNGTWIIVEADGTQGAYTTTYRFGTTAITAALTASRGHTVLLSKQGTVWGATATVHP